MWGHQPHRDSRCWVTNIQCGMILQPVEECALAPVQPVPVTDAFQDIIETLPAGEKYLLQHLELQVSNKELLHLLSTETLSFSSDGSQKAHRASFAWVVSTNVWLERGNIPGHRLGSWQKGHAMAAETPSPLDQTREQLHPCRETGELP